MTVAPQIIGLYLNESQMCDRDVFHARRDVLCCHSDRGCKKTCCGNVLLGGNALCSVAFKGALCTIQLIRLQENPPPPNLAMCRTSGATTSPAEDSCSPESCLLAGPAVRSCWCIRISSCCLTSMLYLVSPFEQGASWVMFVPKGALCWSPAAMRVEGQR